MPVLSGLHKLKGIEFPLALTVALCLFMLEFHPAADSLEPAETLLAILLLPFFVFVFYQTDRKFGYPDRDAIAYIAFYFLIFSSFFYSMKMLNLLFSIFLLLQTIFSMLFRRPMIPIVITFIYSICYYVLSGASKWRGYTDWFLFSLFLLLAGWTVFVRSRYTDKSFFRRILKRRDSIATLHSIGNAISSGAPVDKIMFMITESLGVFTNVVRSSIILVDRNFRHAKIAASFEGEHLRNMKINIKKYPEIQKALTTGKVVTIADIYNSPLTEDIQKEVKPIIGQSVMVIPLKYGDENLGVLFLRGFRGGKGFSREEIKFCETVATLSGQVLFTARLYDELKIKSGELKKTVEQLEEANRMKSVFVANVSHELRTPLTSILGYLQLLTDMDFSKEESMMHLNTIRKNADTLLLLINELIDITKIEAGTFELFYEKGNLNDLVQFVCENIRPRVERAGIRMELKMQNFEEEFFFDVNRIEQVLNNILNNAIKFSPDGTSISVQTSFSEKWGQVSIRDQGIGISKGDQERIFDRFVQAEASFSREKSGAGIGLHLCREIIAMHKGRIWVESMEGSGATFYFKIPLITTADKLSDSVTIGLHSKK